MQVMPRKRHVSRNISTWFQNIVPQVMPRKRHVSRNDDCGEEQVLFFVMPRKRHVSRNFSRTTAVFVRLSHASQEACE